MLQKNNNVDRNSQPTVFPCIKYWHNTDRVTHPRPLSSRPQLTKDIVLIFYNWIPSPNNYLYLSGITNCGNNKEWDLMGRAVCIRKNSESGINLFFILSYDSCMQVSGIGSSPKAKEMTVTEDQTYSGRLVLFCLFLVNFIHPFSMPKKEDITRSKEKVYIVKFWHKLSLVESNQLHNKCVVVVM